MQRFLASVCAACPLCIARRAWPESTYARVMRRIERSCPFCKAYDRLEAQREAQRDACCDKSPDAESPE